MRSKSAVSSKINASFVKRFVTCNAEDLDELFSKISIEWGGTPSEFFEKNLNTLMNDYDLDIVKLSAILGYYINSEKQFNINYLADLIELNYERYWKNHRRKTKLLQVLKKAKFPSEVSTILFDRTRDLDFLADDIKDSFLF